MSEKYEKIKEQCRLRALKHYAKNKGKILEKRALKKNKIVEETINEIEFDLVVMTKQFQDSTKITNETTRKCHLSRIQSFFDIQKKEKLNLFDFQTIIDNMMTASYGKNNTSYQTNSKKNITETFLYCLDNFIVKIEPVIREKYQDYYLTLKIQSMEELQDKKINPIHGIIPWKEYEKRVIERFGVDSKEFLMIKLYEICIARDDFDLYLCSTIKEATQDITKNYLVVNENDYDICMQSYKTSKNKLEPIVIHVPCDISTLLSNYIKKHNITERLFPSTKGKNSSFITEMHKKINVPGGINIIRHILVSTGTDGDMSVKEKVDLSKRSFHSVCTQPDYKRVILNK